MDPRVELITRLLKEKNGCRLSARDAGLVLGISEGYFLRLFKREAGTTFRRYKRAARIAGVVSFLTDYLMPLKQVAVVAGYEDVSNFHRDFKQVRGVSPRQWRLAAFRRRIQLWEGPEYQNCAVLTLPDDRERPQL